MLRFFGFVGEFFFFFLLLYAIFASRVRVAACMFLTSELLRRVRTFGRQSISPPAVLLLLLVSPLPLLLLLLLLLW